jgi:hypothetical protein
MKVVILPGKQNFLLKKCYIIFSQLHSTAFAYKKVCPWLVKVDLHEDRNAFLPKQWLRNATFPPWLRAALIATAFSARL